jgi:hypothetical protein
MVLSSVNGRKIFKKSCLYTIEMADKGIDEAISDIM